MRLLQAIIIFCTIFTYSCDNSLDIKINNKTGYRIDSVMVGEKYIGVIKKAESLLVSDCKKISMQADRPFGCVTGKISGKVEGQCFELCGTGVYDVTKGKYEFDLFLFESDTTYTLRMGIPRTASRLKAWTDEAESRYIARP